MDYLCAKFGNFSFSRFGFIVRTESQRESQTESQRESQTESQRESQTESHRWMIAILTRLPSALVIIISGNEAYG